MFRGSARFTFAAPGFGVRSCAKRTSTYARAAGATGDLGSSLLLMATGPGPGPDGWRVAGYRARGSGAGPHVVGVLRARGAGGRKLMRDIEVLVNRAVAV